MSFDIQQILKGFGLSGESVERVKLSRGVVGRTTYAVALVLVVLALVAARITPDQLLLVGLLAIAVFVIYFVGVIIFASRHPAAALLEGAELLHWHQMEMASKTVATLPALPAQPDLTQPALPAPAPDQLNDEEPA